MKKKSMLLGAILCVAITILLSACSKGKNCDCTVSYYDDDYYTQNTTVSFSDYDGDCRSITFREIVDHVGGDATNSSDYDWLCYER